MKIILLANHLAILPAIVHFHSKKELAAVVSPQKLVAENTQISLLCQQFDIPFYSVARPDLNTTLVRLFHEIKPDLAFICGFPYKIPYQLFTIPSIGCFNIHFSLLPAYAGPDPIFWQIRNGEQMGGITIHRVDEGFDTGKIVMQQQIQFIPGENWGICNSRYATMVLNMLLSLTEAAEKKQPVERLSYNSIAESYYPRPATEDLMINWELQTADEIENLVNASNPSAGGAITLFRQQQVRILEVSPVDGDGPENVPAGTIIHLDGNGLFVQCLNRGLLRINIVHLFEGLITGFKMAVLGIKTGDRFETSFSMQKTLIN